MELFDKKYLYVEWDDFLKGKEVIYGDEIYQIKNCIINDAKAIVTDKSSNECMPFLVCHMGGCYTKRRFVYYDPLFDFKKAFNAGKKVEYENLDVGTGWRPVYDGFGWNEDFEYRIVEEEVKLKPKLITVRQLSEWLAAGNGEYKFYDGTYARASYEYKIDKENDSVNGIVVRRWGENEWHEPTVDYCFPEQGEKNG